MFRSVVLAAMLALPTAALADEAVLDGIRYRIWEGSTFHTFDTMTPLAGSDLPAAVDEMRASWKDWDRYRIMFGSSVQLESPMVIVMEEPEVKGEIMDTLLSEAGKAVYDGDVGIIPRENIRTREGSVDYVVRTGLDFAPVAYVNCVETAEAYGDCRFFTVMDDRLRVVVSNLTVEGRDPAALRKTVVDTIEYVVPDGTKTAENVR